MTDRPLLTIGLREIRRNPGHCQIQVFVGRNENARGNCGTIALRTDEWEDLQVLIENTTEDLLEVMDPLYLPGGVSLPTTGFHQEGET